MSISGLGFNIRGGTDNTYIGSEPGIFVTSIKVDGAAFQDGRLQVGDKILEVNGINLREVTHKEAVKYFQESDDIVRLIVEKAAEARIRQVCLFPISVYTYLKPLFLAGTV